MPEGAFVNRRRVAPRGRCRRSLNRRNADLPRGSSHFAQSEHDRLLCLFRAILLGACDDLGAADAKLRLDAIRWFTEPFSSDVPLNLSEVCATLRMDVGRVRRTALRWAGLA